MNVKNRLTAVSLLLALGAPVPALAHADHGKPAHGGVVLESGEAQFEVVSKDNKVVVHVTQHGTPISMAGASGKLTILAGAAKSEILLKAQGENRLSGEGRIAQAAKLLLGIQMPGGKTLQSRGVAP